MVSVYEVQTLEDAARFVLWTLAVIGAASALFASFPAAELRGRWQARQAAGRRRMEQIGQFLGWNAVPDRSQPKVDGSPAMRELTGAERSALIVELKRLRRAAFWSRAGLWFLSCFLCQTSWTGLAVYLVTRGPDDARSLVATVLSTAALAVLLSTWLGTPRPIAEAARPTGGGCGMAPGRSAPGGMQVRRGDGEVSN